MAEKYGFIGDNWYTDEFLAEYIASFISNGVYNLELQHGLWNLDSQIGRSLNSDVSYTIYVGAQIFSYFK